MRLVSSEPRVKVVSLKEPTASNSSKEKDQQRFHIHTKKRFIIFGVRAQEIGLLHLRCQPGSVLLYFVVLLLLLGLSQALNELLCFASREK